MSKKRDRLQVIYDILEVIRDKGENIKPTHILYKSNLSHQMMQQYLGELITKEFIIEKETKKGKTYSLTEKGFNYLKEYQQITRFVESFGLN
jgi:predicted transcriptional regulator